MDDRSGPVRVLIGLGLLFARGAAAAPADGGCSMGDKGMMCSRTVTCELMPQVNIRLPVSQQAANATWGCTAKCGADEIVTGGGFNHDAGNTRGGAYSMPTGNGWACNIGGIASCTNGGSGSCGGQCYAVCAKASSPPAATPASKDPLLSSQPKAPPTLQVDYTSCDVVQAPTGTWGCIASCAKGELVAGGGFNRAAAVTSGGEFGMPQTSGWICDVGAISSCSNGAPPPCGSQCYAVCLKAVRGPPAGGGIDPPGGCTHDCPE